MKKLILAMSALWLVGCGQPPAPAPEPPKPPARFTLSTSDEFGFGNVHVVTDTKSGLSYIVLEGYTDNHPMAVYPTAPPITDIKELVEVLKQNAAEQDAILGVMKQQLALQKKAYEKMGISTK